MRQAGSSPLGVECVCVCGAECVRRGERYVRGEIFGVPSHNVDFILRNNRLKCVSNWGMFIKQATEASSPLFRLDFTLYARGLLISIGC